MSERISARMAEWLIARVSQVVGRGAVTRPPVTRPDLVSMRTAGDEQWMTSTRAANRRLLERVRAEQIQVMAGARKDPPVIDVLVLSGGGDWGAFGAGFLKGWGKIPASHPLARPEFDVVTGVSTGALIAPFAFLGDEESIDRILNLYRNPDPDWVKQRGVLYFLPAHISFAEVPGLEREMRRHFTLDMVRRIADAGADGRLLGVNTTNLDEATFRVFDLVAEARRAVESGKVERIHDIMLASAGIPGAFPFRMIDQSLYVDGGVTGNIIYGGRGLEEDSILGMWTRLYPDAPPPPVRVFVIFNNQFRPVPEVTPPNWPAVIRRSLETATRASTTIAVRHLFTMAEVARLKYKADGQIYVASIPGDWFPPVPGVFVKETMNDLADLGEKMGADPASWSTSPP